MNTRQKRAMKAQAALLEVLAEDGESLYPGDAELIRRAIDALQPLAK